MVEGHTGQETVSTGEKQEKIILKGLKKGSREIHGRLSLNVDFYHISFIVKQ
jgi:hypothetical protein